MISIGIPGIPSLAEATVELLRRGVTDSNSMGEQLAARFQLAWRLVDDRHVEMPIVFPASVLSSGRPAAALRRRRLPDQG